MDPRTQYRSLFWPILLIGIGIIWLLANLGFISIANLAVLFRLWPLILIAVGLDLLFARRAPLIGALIGLATLAAAIVLLITGPQLGLASGSPVKTERFSEPIGQAASADVTLNLWSDPATISSLTGSTNLIEVEATHTGVVKFEASGEQEKIIRLSHSSGGIPFAWFDFGAGRRVDIRLNPDAPTNLNIDVGSGSAELDLRNLTLSVLEIDGGSGSADVTLPPGGESFNASIRSGSGSVTMTVPDGAQGEIRLDTGSGSVVLDVPEDAPVRVEVRDSGSGSVDIAAGLEQVEQGRDDEGVWESSSFNASDRKILIIFEDIGSGSVRVR